MTTRVTPLGTVITLVGDKEVTLNSPIELDVNSHLAGQTFFLGKVGLKREITVFDAAGAGIYWRVESEIEVSRGGRPVKVSYETPSTRSLSPSTTKDGGPITARSENPHAEIRIEWTKGSKERR